MCSTGTVWGNPGEKVLPSSSDVQVSLDIRAAPLFYELFYFPAQVVGRRFVVPPATFWTSRGYRRFPFSIPQRAAIFVPAFIACSIPTPRRFSSNLAKSCSRAFREAFFYAKKTSLTSTKMRSVGFELTKSTLVGTRLTYRPTGDTRC